MTEEEAAFLEEFLRGSYYSYLLAFYKETIRCYRCEETMSKDEATHRIRLLNEFYHVTDLKSLGPSFFNDPDDAPIFDFDLQKMEAEKADNVVLLHEYRRE